MSLSTQETTTPDIRVLCIGAGNMGRSHAKAYQDIDGFQVVGICTRSRKSADDLNAHLQSDYPHFADFDEALKTTKPDAVCIASYPETHAEFASKAMQAGCHVFVEKPLADSVDGAKQIIEQAEQANRKVVVGYILRHHPSWVRFIEIAKSLGKPLVMRMNLNQSSCAESWETHKNMMATVSPIVDCGVHYVDVMAQMTESNPTHVSGIGARLTDEVAPNINNYGQLQVTFADGSVGWYEAGWGPMMSETAFFIKDVVGPKGSVSIVANSAAAAGQSANVDAHTQTNSIRIHHSELDASGQFAREDEVINLDDEPDHDELCRREQQYFLKAIREDLDLTEHLRDAVNSMRIVEAAEASFRSKKMIEL
ncbi:Gfo/Idh/MocA family protein [Rubripirellula obstinata]|uniref:Gfo/Idh/MocA family protein n=1 Tax=Rubripirellula obstinata TaxID=406547 RepID=UPI0021BBF7C1|nr:Gfo/Idh/MocA family oxidoreductase [Rubripirellula obstinata]